MNIVSTNAPEKKYGLISFILGCIIFLVSALPFSFQNEGVFLYYGDVDGQQIPFTISFSGTFDLPQFDFNAGPGLDYIDAYSFYNLFSPFSLIFKMFPRDAAANLFVFVIALKFGVCALTAYIYISRFCGNGCFAVTGSLLYAFSGYSLITLVFHYLDALAFFPLLLASLEYAVVEKRRGVFGITVTICALTNYYMFGMEAIFVIIYFLVRLTDSRFRISVKDFFCLAAETAFGLAAAGIVIVPALVYIISSPRLGEGFQNAEELFVYETPWRYARILQAVFISPDLLGYTNFFPDCDGTYPCGSKWACLTVYLPLFGISGTAAYISANRKSWQTKLMAVCAVIALIPALNSIFSIGSALYYARWMFAPTLIAACMTASSLETEPRHFKAGFIISGAAVVILAVFSVMFPIETLCYWKDTYHSIIHIISQLIFTAAGVVVSALIVFRMTRDEQFPIKVTALTVLTVFLFTEMTLLFGMGNSNSPEVHYYSLKNVPETERTELGYRIVTEDRLKIKTLCGACLLPIILQP